jgi:hypothetical protein
MTHTPEVVGIGILFEEGSRRSPEAKLRLAQAYTAVFRGNPTRQDQDIVITDLADHCGFYRVLPQGASPDERSYREGQRSAYGRIVSHLSMTWDEIRAFERAARKEAFVNQVEGDY